MGECVTAIYAELALLSLFELLDEIDDLAATSGEEIAAKRKLLCCVRGSCSPPTVRCGCQR